MHRSYFLVFVVVLLFASCNKNGDSSPSNNSGLVINLNSNKIFRVNLFVTRDTTQVAYYSQGGLTQPYQFTSTNVKSGDHVSLDLVSSASATLTGTVTYNGQNINYTIYNPNNPGGNQEKDWVFFVP